jgi:siroheme synthase-like protein
VSTATALFPVFLKLDGLRVLVVGGGRVAAGRIATLLRSGARVTVVAPEIRDEIAATPVHLLRRRFVTADVDGAWLVIAAADRETNRAVAAAAATRGVFVNAVDDVEAASAYSAGVLRRGGVTIAVSTEGRAPALAGLLREALEALIPDHVGRWVEVAAAARREQQRAGVPIEQRRPLLLRTLEALYATRERALEPAP